MAFPTAGDLHRGLRIQLGLVVLDDKAAKERLHAVLSLPPFERELFQFSLPDNSVEYHAPMKEISLYYHSLIPPSLLPNLSPIYSCIPTLLILTPLPLIQTPETPNPNHQTLTIEH